MEEKEFEEKEGEIFEVKRKKISESDYFKAIRTRAEGNCPKELRERDFLYLMCLEPDLKPISWNKIKNKFREESKKRKFIKSSSDDTLHKTKKNLLADGRIIEEPIFKKLKITLKGVRFLEEKVRGLKSENELSNKILNKLEGKFV